MRIEVPANEERRIFREVEGESRTTIILHDHSKVWYAELARGDVSSEIEIIHKGRSSFSRVYAGAIARASKVRMKAILRIGEEAEGADGKFGLHCLVLEDSQIEQRPELDVNNKNVKAGHSASIERPGDEEIFYLKSRGIRDPEALLVEAFTERMRNLVEE